MNNCQNAHWSVSFTYTTCNSKHACVFFRFSKVRRLGVKHCAAIFCRVLHHHLPVGKEKGAAHIRTASSFRRAYLILKQLTSTTERKPCIWHEGVHFGVVLRNLPVVVRVELGVGQMFPQWILEKLGNRWPVVHTTNVTHCCGSIHTNPSPSNLARTMSTHIEITMY